jgi:TP901 family phage tail tape measure protein
MASGVHKEKIQLDIEIGGNKARKQLNDLKDQAKGLRDEQSKLRKDKKALIKTDANYKSELKRVTKALSENKAALSGNRKEQNALREKIGLTSLTTRELSSELRRLKNIQSNLIPNTAKWDKYQHKIKAVEQRMGQLRSGTSKLGLAMKNMSSKLSSYAGMMMVVGFAAYKAYDLFIRGNKELSDQLADVQKKTNLTRRELLGLYRDLLKLDTRTSRKELLELASVAGRLGVSGRRNLLQFVAAADKLKVSIGEDLGDNTDDAIREVGKLVDIFHLDEQFGLEKSMLKIGSAINELGQNSTAQEKYIVEFSKRVAGIAPQADISITKVMGLAASLDILGQSSEVSSTVYAQIIPKMFTDTETYANLAGMSVKDFSNLLKTDANEAFIKLLEGLNGNNEGMEVLATKMAELGLEGKRTISVLGALSGNVELVREQQDLANNSFIKGTSVTEEFNKKNQNLAGNLDKIAKWSKELFVNSSLMTGLKNITGSLVDWMRVPVADTLRVQRLEMNKQVMQITSLNQGDETRLGLLDKLVETFPEYWGQIDKATISNNELFSSLQNVNRQMIRQIYIEGRKEELRDLQEQASKKLAVEMQYRDQLDALKAGYFSKMGTQQQAMFAGDFDFMMQHFGKIKRNSKSHIDWVIKTESWLERQKMGKQNKGGLEFGDMVELAGSYSDWKTAYKAKYKAEQDAGKDEARINKLENEWGIGDTSGGSAFKKKGSKPNESGIVQETIDVEGLRIQTLKDSKEVEMALETKRHNEKLKKYKNNAKALEYEQLIHSRNVTDINLKFLDKQIADSTFNHGQKMAVLEESYKNEEITKVEYNDRKRKLEHDFQEDMHNFKMQYRVASNDKLMDMELEAIRQTYEFKQLTIEEQEEALDTIRAKWGKRRKKQTAANMQDEIDIITAAFSDEKMELYKKAKAWMDITGQLGEAMGEAFYQMLSGQKNFAQTFLLMALDMVQKYVNLMLVKMMAESLAQTDSIMTWGAAGIARYAILSGLVNAAFGVAKSAISSSGKSKQKRSGGYTQVTGEDDNMTYNARILSSAETGWLPNHPVLMPSGILASEAGQEYFVDTPSLNSSLRDQMGLSVADHVSMIEAMKGSSVPQRASGGYGQVAPDGSAVDNDTPQFQQISFPPEFVEAMNYIAKNGVKAYMPYSGNGGFKETEKKYKAMEDDVSL